MCPHVCIYVCVYLTQTALGLLTAIKGGNEPAWPTIEEDEDNDDEGEGE